MRLARVALALATTVVGVALIVVTAIHGGGQVGYALGALFTIGGAGRLYIVRKGTTH